MKNFSQLFLSPDWKEWTNYIPVAFQSLDINGNIIHINQKWLDFLGYTKKQVIGKWFGDFIHSDHVDFFRSNFEKAKSMDELHDVEFTLLHSSGELRDVKYDAMIIHDRQGKFLRTFCLMADVSEQKKMQDLIAQNEKLLNQVFDIADVGMRLIDKNFNIIKANQAYSQLNKLPLDSIIGKKCYELMCSHDCKKKECSLTQIFQKNQAVKKNIEHTRKDGIKVSIELSAFPFWNEKDELVGILESFKDITQLKNTEKALRQSERLYQSLFQNSLTGIGLASLDGYVLDGNQSIMNMTGYTLDEIKKFSIKEMYYHPSDREKLIAEIKKNKYIKDFETRLIKKNGDIIDVVINVIMITYNDVPYLLTTLMDITEQKRIAEKAQNEVSKLNIIIETISEGITMSNTKGFFEIFNSKMEEITGYKKKEVNNFTDFLSLLYPDENYKNMVCDEIDLLFKKKETQNIETEIQTQKGEKKTLLVSSKIFSMDNQDWLLSAYRDITKIKKEQDQLAQSEKRLKTIVDNIPLLINALDQDGNFVFWNKECEKVTGYESGEILNNPDANRLLYPDSEYYDQMLREWEQQGNYFQDWELKLESKNQGPKTISWTSIADKVKIPGWANWAIGVDHTEKKQHERDIQLLSIAVKQSGSGIVITDIEGRITFVNHAFEELTGYQKEELFGKKTNIVRTNYHGELFYKNLWNQILSGQIWKGEFFNKKKDGTTYWENATIAPIKDQNGQIINFVAIKDDITLRKQTEEQIKKAKEKAEEVSELKSSFLANMSHEIRTPMNSIIGFTDLLVTDEKDPQKKEQLGIIQKSGKHLLNIINDILDYSKIEAGELNLKFSNFSIKNLLGDIFSEFKIETDEKELQLTLNFEKNIPDTIYSDPFRIKQMLINLLNNALKFTEKGKIEIQLFYSEPWIEIKVKDTGIGIPEDKLELIFSEFVQVDNSHQRNYEGTGLGLSIVKKIVKLLKGNIMVDSQLGEGSVFTVKFPVKAFSAQFDIKKKEKTDMENSNQKEGLSKFTVLIAEDNEANYKLLNVLVKRLGLQTDWAKDGLQTLEKLKSKKFDLLLLDMFMPNKDGLDTIKDIRGDDSFKNLYVIALTANVMKEDQEKYIAAGCNDFLAKPINKNQLYEKITAALKI